MPEPQNTRMRRLKEIRAKTGMDLAECAAQVKREVEDGTLVIPTPPSPPSPPRTAEYLDRRIAFLEKAIVRDEEILVDLREALAELRVQRDRLAGEGA